MECLVVKKDGYLYNKSWVYNKEKDEGKYEETFLDPKYLNENNEFYVLSLLNNKIELEDGFTIRDWFKLVLNYPRLQFLDGFFNGYIEEYENCPKENCTDPDNQVVAISFKKFVELTNYDKNENFDCEIFIDVSGISNDPEAIHYGIDFWPLKNYLDTPIKLEKCEIFKQEKIEKDYKRELVDIHYTLFDLITSFIYEISFFGSPEKRDEKIKELNQQVQDIKDGKAELVPWNFDEEKNDT